MNDRDRATAEKIHADLALGRADHFRAALLEVAPSDRDAWVDLALGLGELADDGPALPRGGTPYLPCSVDALLRIVELAGITEADTFVDLGAGAGRAGALIHLLTGARVVGVEIQPHLAEAARALAARIHGDRVSLIEGDAAERVRDLAVGTVFFLYCPFGGDRLARALDALEQIARMRSIRVCCVDLPLPARDGLTLAASSQGDVTVHRSRAR